MFVKKDRSIKKVVKNRKCNWHSLKKSRGKPFKFNNSSKERQLSINTTSKLNVPLLPKGKRRQPVIGTYKYLLPYFTLNKYFKVLALEKRGWTLQENVDFIHSLGITNEPIIRLLITPDSLVDKENNYRVTAMELCILFYKYGYELYQLKTKKNEYFSNIYFMIKKNNKLVVNKEQLTLINKNSKKIINF